jgi:hypothetical protein
MLRMGAGKASLRGLFARLAGSSNPSLCRGYDDPSKVPSTTYQYEIRIKENTQITPNKHVAFRIYSME